MKHVWTITFCLLILTIISIFNTLSFSLSVDGNVQVTDLVTKQLLYISFGWIIYVLLSRTNYVILKYLQTNIIFYSATIILLLSTLIWGPIINNTQRWLLFGDFQFQPSELAKVVLVIFMGYLFSLRGKIQESWILVLNFVILLPILIIIYLQPHGSMSIIILLTWAILIFTSMTNQLRNILLLLVLSLSAMIMPFSSLSETKYVLLIIGALFVVSLFAYYAREYWRKALFVSIAIGFVIGVFITITWNILLLDYQKERINAFFNPVETSQDLGFNVDQSRVAIGAGRIFGKGWGFGTQSKLQFLPEYQTDFVFAAFSEEFGLVGSASLIILYVTIIFSVLFYAFKSTKMDFEFVVLTGISIKLFLEVFINIGTNTGLIPATGIPLPLMSVGGTSILLLFFSLGLVQSIISNNQEKYREISYCRVDNDEVLL